MAMADLVMPRLPDQQQAWFPRQSTGHHRSFSYHLPQPQSQSQKLAQFQHQEQQQHQQPSPPYLQPHPQQQLRRQSEPQNQYHQYAPPPLSQPQPQQPFQKSNEISPVSSTTSSSPVSPRNYHGRQVRPLYMPAVLRPNVYHSAGHPLKASPTGESDDEERVIRSSGSFTSLFGIPALSKLSRKPTIDSGKVVDWDWDLANYPVVNGQPTRRHWKADFEADVCDDPTCKRFFNYFVRRHHCRRCGNIFCDSHSNYEVPLDESANYNPRGQPSRSCEHCYGDFKVWRGRNSSQVSAVRPQQHPAAALGSRTVPASPMSASPTNSSPSTPGKGQPEVAISVPSDWNWSTF